MIHAAHLIAAFFCLTTAYLSLRDWWWYARPYNFFEFRLGFGLLLLAAGILTLPWEVLR